MMAHNSSPLTPFLSNPLLLLEFLDDVTLLSKDNSVSAQIVDAKEGCGAAT